MKTIDNKRISELIAELKRKRIIRNQADFAERIDISSSVLSEIINGKRTVSEKFVRKICDNFPVSFNWFYTGKGDIIKEENSDIPQKGQLEFDFTSIVEENNKIADAVTVIAESNNKVSDAVQTIARSNEKLADTNGKMYEDNREIISKLVESIARIEEKIDQKGGAEDVKDVAQKAALG